MFPLQEEFIMIYTLMEEWQRRVRLSRILRLQYIIKEVRAIGSLQCNRQDHLHRNHLLSGSHLLKIMFRNI